MKSKRKAIGRTFSKVVINDLEPSNSNEKIMFHLASGKESEFKKIDIDASELKEKTYVDFLVNGREQQAITPESVADICRTIKHQQFFPAIGRQVGNKIEILDGSRRRAAALFSGVGLRILVTDSAISFEDARQLAADIQTAKEHNLREVGLRLLAQRDAGFTQKELAQSNGLSQAKVTRAIQAASVPDMLLNIFPDQSELTYPDYKMLLDLHQSFERRLLNMDELMATMKLVRQSLDAQLTSADMKSALINSYKKESASMMQIKKEKAAVVTKLWHFKDSNIYARKRTKDRQFSYEFSRMPAHLQQQLDKVVQQAIENHFKEQLVASHNFDLDT